MLRTFKYRTAMFGAIATIVPCAAPHATKAAATPAQEEVTRDFQKTLQLNPGQSFRIENKFGEVRIHGESNREVKISATIRVQAHSREQADASSQKIQIDVQQTGEGIQVRTIFPDEGKWFTFGKGTSYSVNYDIAIPSDAPLFVRNSFGSAIATGVRARAEVDNNHGSVTVRDSGPTRINNSFGSVELNSASGDSLINDSNGSVNATEVKGALEIHNRFGSITVRSVQGQANITGGNGSITVSDTGAATIINSFGTVEVRNVRGDLTVHDNNGNVDVTTVGGGAVVSNSFGNINFSDVKGRLEASTSNGRVKGTSVGGGPVTIRDSFGAIELENIAGTLDAETSNGKITVRDARGAVTLKTSFGAIEAANIPKGIHATTGNGAINLADIGGDAYAKTSFGAIIAERINGNFFGEDSNGSVTARQIKGDAQVTTSFSGVNLEGIGGRITVDNQNGAIDVSAMRPASGCRDISLKTSFSSIRVRVPDGIGYNLTARTSFGRINSDLPVTASGSIGGDALNGTIGSGGCKLQLTNSNGSIEISKGS